MKKIVTISILLGVVIGWGLTEYRARRELHRIQQFWSPEFQAYVTDCMRTGKILQEITTEEDAQNVLMLAEKVSSDLNSQTYAKAKQSILVKKMLMEGKIEKAIDYLESSETRLLEKYKAGDFNEDIHEEAVQKMVEALIIDQL